MLLTTDDGDIVYFNNQAEQLFGYKIDEMPGKWSFTGVYQDFTAQSGSADWGTGLNLAAGGKFGDRNGRLFKAAMYDADRHTTDTTKFWIMLTANYWPTTMSTTIRCATEINRSRIVVIANGNSQAKIV